MAIVLAAHMTWTCSTRARHSMGGSAASALAFSRARSPRRPVLRFASQVCMRVKKSSPARMRAALLKGSLRARGGASASASGRLERGGRPDPLGDLADRRKGHDDVECGRADEHDCVREVESPRSASSDRRARGRGRGRTDRGAGKVERRLGVTSPLGNERQEEDEHLQVRAKEEEGRGERPGSARGPRVGRLGRAKRVTHDDMHEHLDGHAAVPPREVVALDVLDLLLGDRRREAVKDGRVPQQAAHTCREVNGSDWGLRERQERTS